MNFNRFRGIKKKFKGRLEKLKRSVPVIRNLYDPKTCFNVQELRHEYSKFKTVSDDEVKIH